MNYRCTLASSLAIDYHYKNMITLKMMQVEIIIASRFEMMFCNFKKHPKQGNKKALFEVVTCSHADRKDILTPKKAEPNLIVQNTTYTNNK